MAGSQNSNVEANKLLYIFMFIGVIPLIIIFGIYLNNSDSLLLNNIAARTGSLPAVLSSNNPLMTKVMDVYCKSAPLLAFVLFLLSIKKRQLIKKTNRGILIRSCLMVRKLNRPLLGFLTMNGGKEEPHMVWAVAE